MGREAKCRCRWADQDADCKVLLETNELIVRGVIRRRVLIASLAGVKVQGGQLRFRAGEDDVALDLGPSVAQRWAEAITNPPPSLARKLGISGDTRLLIAGDLDSDELKAAASEAASTNGKAADLILARVKTDQDLNDFLRLYSAHPGNPPAWMIYAKGPKSPLGEMAIRTALRNEGFIDTKIASVSEKLTALRFIKRVR